MHIRTFKLLPSIGVAVLAMLHPAAVFAEEYSISVDKIRVQTDGGTRNGVGFNGESPGPVLRFREGEEVTINVTNNLNESTSIHWHGLILPYQMDGVPDISYAGIAPGETFTYRFPIVQSGTYWFHSHSGFQEPDGAFGSIVIDPAKREPFKFDRDYVVQLSDAHPHRGAKVMRNLKRMPDYYNRTQQTLGDFFTDAGEQGIGAAIGERKAWGAMRMMRTDIEDLQGFTGLINGKSSEQNWLGVFEPGERVRLRLINSSAMTYFDVRIPGLEMLVVQADGNNIQPVSVEELRIAVAETYDVIVRPKEDQAYTIFAESMGRTGFARGTLAPRQGMEAEIPALRKAPLLTLADMTMDTSMPGMDHSNMPGMDHSKMDQTETDPFYAVGSGLKPSAAQGGKFLSYADLKAQTPLYEDREPSREIELRLTGNMERYIWSINNVKYEDAEPIRLKYGERVRFKFVNETMMAHPMHLHGMWSILDTGNGEWNPAKHTINIAPGMVVYSDTEVDAEGQWAFHCHLSYHMDAGMFRKIIVEGGPKSTANSADMAVANAAIVETSQNE